MMCNDDVCDIVFGTRKGFTKEYTDVKMLPDPSADVLCWLDAGSEVVLDLDESTKRYYKVCTVSGIEGYCSARTIQITE